MSRKQEYMNTSLVTFATQTEDAHIAIVEADNHKRQWQWQEVQRQFSAEGFSVPVWGRMHVLKYQLHLNNGTVISFFTSEQYEQMQGWRFDRIQTTPAAQEKMPSWFLANRLKSGIAPQVGIEIRNEQEA